MSFTTSRDIHYTTLLCCDVARCRVCNLQLTLKTFLVSEETSPDGATRTRVVYCSVHQPKQTRGHITGDAVGIRSALEAQRRATAKVTALVPIAYV